MNFLCIHIVFHALLVLATLVVITLRCFYPWRARDKDRNVQILIHLGGVMVVAIHVASNSTYTWIMKLGGGIAFFVFLHRTSKKVRVQGRRNKWFTTIAKKNKIKLVKLTNLRTQLDFLGFFWASSLSSFVAMYSGAVNRRRWLWIMQKGQFGIENDNVSFKCNKYESMHPHHRQTWMP